MPRIATLLLCLALAGCALTPAGAPSPPPWRDDLFAASDAPTALGDPFALSPAMARHLREVVAPRLRTQGRQQALVDALLRDARLRLEYDGAVT
ncbi:MAG TPA: hypothetical protein VFX50_15465, partial [Gemmatimonadales bacterium]|nr:hypothetical protein [Gemmatimonadales bacterium]